MAVFLDMDATDDERRAVAAAIGSDPRVAGYRYETSEQAFERFEILWRDQPRVVASTGPDGLPASFRVELADPARYAAFRADVDRLDGVADVIGSVCR